jgi:hypothetical protein
MTIWEPIDCGSAPGTIPSTRRLQRMANEGSTIVLYHTSERGWYGWLSVDTIEDDPMERVCPILLADGTIAAVCGSQIIKAAAAIGIEAPDEI